MANAIARAIVRCRQLGYVDDSLLQPVRPQPPAPWAVFPQYSSLAKHHVDPDLIATAIDEADESLDDGDLLAAFVFARRRRMRPFDPRMQLADLK